MIAERYELMAERMRQIELEDTTKEEYGLYFKKVSKFFLMIFKLQNELESGSYYGLSLEELAKWNDRLYEDILPESYEKSYANPAYAAKALGEGYGQILSFLYTEIRGSIVYAFEKKIEQLTILMELFVEVYNCFEAEETPHIHVLEEIIYWYASDYCDVFAAERIEEQIGEGIPFAEEIISKLDLSDIRYLYFYGEYVSENERQTALHLNTLEESIIKTMADVYTEGYKNGFINTGKDLSKKEMVNIRYVLGFERVVKKSIENFGAMGLRPVINRAPVSALTRHRNGRIGYRGGIANKQFEYDHKEDMSLFFDKKFVERKLDVIKNTYEAHKDRAAKVAGPAVMEVFGEKEFLPERKEMVLKFSEKQEQLSLVYEGKSGQMTNHYIPGEERSFTCIAYPIPEIGKQYKEIFNEVININTLDASLYEQVQQKLIDALDQGEYVHVTGAKGNRTDLKIHLCKIHNPEKETGFENCVADVNIPVGEVFTSPVLEGTNGILHVSRVYMRDLVYEELEIAFTEGMVTDYNCKNYETESDCKKYVLENVMFNHETLPLGEFAIGTNTTAYAVAKRYGIEHKLPVLIAEKMGPHFAVGDTCYSWSEDVTSFNKNGKEIVAKENTISKLRTEDLSKAYFHCHTDITIPYEEIGSICVVTAEGKEIPLLSEGEFALPGTEVLNDPLKKMNK